jgi:sec-independent protein translocase protein TatB
MIPQVGIQELLVIGVIALVVVGPKDLPLLMRKVGKMMAQAKKLAREFQSTFDELGRQAELEELRKEVEALKRDTTGDLEKDLNRTNREISDAVRLQPKPATPASATPAAEGAANTIAPPAAPIHPAAAPKLAGPRIEPVAQARPRPAASEVATDMVKTDTAS